VQIGLHASRGRPQLGAEWHLYESEVVQSSPEIQLLGYRSLTVGSDVLASYFGRVVALSLPVSPDLSSHAGVDGTTTQLAVFGDVDSGWRFQWWSESPPQWQPLVALAREMARPSRQQVERTRRASRERRGGCVDKSATAGFLHASSARRASPAVSISTRRSGWKPSTDWSGYPRGLLRTRARPS